MREIRVKDYRFPATTPTSGGNLANVYTDHVLNGELLKVESLTNNTGSLFLAISGTGELLWSDITPSGTAVQINYPFVYGDTGVNNATGSPQAFFRRELRDVLFIAGSGMNAGSIPMFNVVYR